MYHFYLQCSIRGASNVSSNWVGANQITPGSTAKSSAFATPDSTIASTVWTTPVAEVGTDSVGKVGVGVDVGLRSDDDGVADVAGVV